MMEVTVDCDLRHMLGPARDQGHRPTCMAFSASDAHAAVRPNWQPLSCEFAYYHAVKRDGGTANDGASLDAVLAAIREDGQPPEEAWTYLGQLPQDLAAWKPPAKVSPLFRRGNDSGGASIQIIRDKLDAGTPLIVGMWLSDAFYTPDNFGVVESGEPPDPHRRHAVVAVGHGHQGKRRFVLVRNSWGASWGIDGHAWLSEKFLAARLRTFGEMKEDLTNVSSSSCAAISRGSVA